MRRIVGVLGLMGCVLGSTVAHAAEKPAAEAANPALVARDSGIADDSDESNSLDISALDVQVEVVGNLAQTTVTARFDNTRGGMLEGTFSLQLPEGAVVTGYALDVDGDLLDGVLVPPIRARRAYEERVRTRVDPGIAEVARDNVFSTRVYPILEGKGRTVRLSFAAPFQADGFTLPLATDRTVASVELGVRVRAAAESPAVVWPVAVESEWRRTNAGLSAEVTLRDRKLSGALRIAPARSAGRAFATRHPSGKTFVELRDVVMPTQQVAIPRSARVYWDRSLSRRDDRIAAELEVLERYFATTGLTRIEVVPFASGGAVPRTASGATQVANLLRDLPYRGATSFDVLAGGGAGKVDVCLMFTDGVSTIDTRPELELGCPLYIVTSAPDADLGYLQLLARHNGGQILRLEDGNVAALVHALRWPAPRVVGVRSADGGRVDFAPLPAGGHGWALVAEADADELVVRVAVGARVTVEKHYRIEPALGRFEAAGALWAHDRVSQIAGDGRRQKELEMLSRRFSVASPAMSFIVLETPRDYVNANIEPPRAYPKRRLAQYREARRVADAQVTARRGQWIEQLVQEWRGQKQWWSTDFGRAAREKPERPVTEALQRDVGAGRARTPSAAPSEERVEEVVVTGVRASSRSSLNILRAVAVDAIAAEDIASFAQPEISVQLAPWDPQRPYLRALDAAVAADFSRVFDAQEREFGSMPVFYFDVAEWLFRKQRVPEAVEMLLSALELPARDTETVALVADRLLRYGQLDRAIWLYEEVCRLDPDRPQPARTLALALERRAAAARTRSARKDLDRALELLTRVVTTPPEDRYRGVELVALMDANGIIPRLRALGEREFALDARLIDVLDVDLRVVIEWNTGATDMDLWVDQPDGERSIYSNPRTAIGGMLSNDMTEGYGPEEYLLRRAVDGEYAIRVDVYANDRLNPNGATMVTAHLTRNYGRADQTTETMELELSPRDQGQKLVGSFKVGAAGGAGQGLSGLGKNRAVGKR